MNDNNEGIVNKAVINSDNIINTLKIINKDINNDYSKFIIDMKNNVHNDYINRYSLNNYIKNINNLFS